jgi:hypothetical protein
MIPLCGFDYTIANQRNPLQGTVLLEEHLSAWMQHVFTARRDSEYRRVAQGLPFMGGNEPCRDYPKDPKALTEVSAIQPGADKKLDHQASV